MLKTLMPHQTQTPTRSDLLHAPFSIECAMPTPTPQPRGGFAKLAFALAAAKGDLIEAHRIASRWAALPELSRITKAAVDSGTTSDATWAGNLADFRKLSGQFCELLRPATIIGRLRGLRAVPMATRTLREDVGASGGWVQEGVSTPLSQMSLAEVLLSNSKAQAGIVTTDELVRTWSPTSERALEGAMVKALAATLDRLFIDSTIAETDAGPASITNSGTSIASTGGTAAQVTVDLKAVVQAQIDAGSDLSTATWILHPRTALALSLLENSAGLIVFPKIGPLGGELLGLPALTSGAVPIDTGDDTYITLIDGSRVLLADDGLAAVDVSRQSSLQMRTDPQTGAQTLVSLWQNNLVGLRLTRWIRWEAVDANAAVTLTDVSY